MKIPLFIRDQKVSGTIDIKIDKKKKLDHMGIRVELIGQIDLVSEVEKGSSFMCNGFDLEPSGTLYSDKTYDFCFDVFQKPYDSYYGDSITLKYLIKCSIFQGGFGAKPLTKEKDIGVIIEKEIPEVLGEDKVVMEVGIDDLLNIKIQIPRKHYYLDSSL